MPVYLPACLPACLSVCLPVTLPCHTSSLAPPSSLLPHQSLTEWRSLALSIRPRVLWVAAHYLELPSLLDETWGLLLGCVEEALVRWPRAAGDGRQRHLAVSATDGVLFRPAALPLLVSECEGCMRGGEGCV